MCIRDRNKEGFEGFIKVKEGIDTVFYSEISLKNKKTGEIEWVSEKRGVYYIIINNAVEIKDGAPLSDTLKVKIKIKYTP